MKSKISIIYFQQAPFITFNIYKYFEILKKFISSAIYSDTRSFITNEKERVI